MRAQNCSKAVLLFDGEKLARALLLGQSVIPPARLAALAPVPAPVCQKRAEDAPAREGHAHRPVDEGLKLNVLRQLIPQLLYLIKTELAGEDYPFRAHRAVDHSGGVVHRVRLGAYVRLKLGRRLAEGGEHTDIGYYCRVRSDVP